MKTVYKWAVFTLLIVLQACGAKKEDNLEALLQKRKELDERISQIMETQPDSLKETNTRLKYVEVISVEPAQFNHYIEVQGVANTDKNVMLTAKASGTVEGVYVEEGIKVKKGQLLLKIDDDILSTSISEVKTSLAFASELFEKQKSLWNQKIGSEVQYLQAKNNKEALESKLATLREQLSMTRVTSPISGIVENVAIKEGEMATPGMPLVQVVDLAEFEIKATVAENFSRDVKNGTPAEIYFPDLKESILSEVSYAGNVIDPVNRTFTVLLKIKNPGIPIKPNMVAVVKILDFQEENGLSVPLNSIQNSNDQQFLFVADTSQGNAVARKRQIVTEVSYGGKALVVQGINPSEKVITFGYQDLTDGQLISY